MDTTIDLVTPPHSKGGGLPIPSIVDQPQRVKSRTRRRSKSLPTDPSQCQRMYSNQDDLLSAKSIPFSSCIHDQLFHEFVNSPLCNPISTMLSFTPSYVHTNNRFIDDG